MPTVQIDFIGMCLVIQDQAAAGRISVGHFRDPGHINLLFFTHEDETTSMALLPRPATDRDPPVQLRLEGCEDLGPTVVTDHGRLPDVPGLVAEDADRTRVDKALGVQIGLAHGTFEAMLPVIKDAVGPWEFGSAPRDLTDRCRFTCSTDQLHVTLNDAAGVWRTLHARGGVISATVVALDHDIAGRVTRLQPGLKLEEFQLFYRCTDKSGAVPVYRGNTVPLNPGNPICPDGMINLAPPARDSVRRSR